MKSFLHKSYEDDEAVMLYQFITTGHIAQDSAKMAKAIEAFTSTCPSDYKVYKIEFHMQANIEIDVED
jgi:hypothetical protein